MSCTLSHLTGSRLGETEVFESESVLIGRGQHNDVMLDLFADATVSTNHAEIRMEGDKFILYDMGSLNGTYLNDHVIRRAALSTGDEICLGRTGPRLKFNIDREAAIERHPSQPKERVGQHRKAPKTTSEQSLSQLASSVKPRLDPVVIIAIVLTTIAAVIFGVMLTR